MVDVRVWEFAEETHPVYERPLGEERWPVAYRGWTPTPYEEVPGASKGLWEQPFPQQEPERMTFDLSGAVDLYVTAQDNVVIRMRLNSRYVTSMDLSEIRALGTQMYEAFRALSRGPLSLQELRRLGHPYGYDVPRGGSRWEALRNPREVPWRSPFTGQSLRHVRGMRGSVGTLDVVNLQTGQFERAWRWNMIATGGSVTLSFWNERKSRTGAPVAWFLAHGTIYMQAHGPWTVVPERFWPLLVRAWRAEALRASLRRSAYLQQFGTSEEPNLQV